jgi:hypothetical protein
MITLRVASQDDCPLLGRLNRELIVAEQSDNRMNDAQLVARMQDFLMQGYQAWIFEHVSDCVGYALVHMHSDPVYVRHFLIVPAMRRQGWGRMAWQQLHHELGHVPIDIDVLAWNSSGHAFWTSMGFAPRAVRMRLTKE